MILSAESVVHKQLLPFLSPIEGELRQVEEIISGQLTSEVRTVEAVSRHILDAGGKRLRPALVILSAYAVSSECDRLRTAQVAAGAELIHTATLVHDDVIDDADARRGRLTANSLWGNRISVLTGDYMLAKAFSLLTLDGGIGVMRALSAATVAMAEGEIAQIEARGDAQALADSYLAIIRNKTAEFMSACCRIGPILASGSPSVEEALSRYGMDLGMAFQITDDLLDLIGDPNRTGKPVGGDLREGKVTMPIILAMERASESEREMLESIIRAEDVSEPDIEFARQIAESTGAVEATRMIASDYVTRAIGHLGILPLSQAHTSLEGLARHIINRGS